MDGLLVFDVVGLQDGEHRADAGEELLREVLVGEAGEEGLAVRELRAGVEAREVHVREVFALQSSGLGAEHRDLGEALVGLEEVA
ncbi:MAG: hypothetical protein IPF92_15560 [Myxococcales bacterium]|nr:hypothetical protein [Myxococcales bacterium]